MKNGSELHLILRAERPDIVKCSAIIRFVLVPTLLVTVVALADLWGGAFALTTSQSSVVLVLNFCQERHRRKRRVVVVASSKRR